MERMVEGYSGGSLVVENDCHVNFHMVLLIAWPWNPPRGVAASASRLAFLISMWQMAQWALSRSSYGSRPMVRLDRILVSIGFFVVADFDLASF